MIRNFTSVTKYYDIISNKFVTYIIVENGVTLNVPLDPANTDYQAIQEWIKEGGEVIDNPRSDNPPTE
jgi:hypothetical protein